MLLLSMTLTNFRCYDHIQFDDLEHLVIFIGENDAGKTVLLDAIEILVGTKNLTLRDFRRRSNHEVCDQIDIEGHFKIESHDNIPDEFRSGLHKHELKIRKHYERNEEVITHSIVVVGQGYVDEGFDEFRGAENQKKLLSKYGFTPGSNEPRRLAQLNELIESGKLARIEKQIALTQSQSTILAQNLPVIERVSASEYRTPEVIIQRTLQKVIRDALSAPNLDTGVSEELPALQEIRQLINTRLNEEINKAFPILQSKHKMLQQVSVVPLIDFTRSVTTNRMVIDCGAGEQDIDSFGDGTKRKIWMGWLEWERQTTEGLQKRSVFRLYDEPDVNLHYDSQRQLFESIQSFTTHASSRTQCFICTHSMFLIDRAPIHSINLIRIANDNQRTLHRIRIPTEQELIGFLDQIGESIGLTNSALLYERAFLVIEGQSEQEAIPIIYKNLYGRSIREDGIVIIPLHGCGAWKPIVEMLLANRKEKLHFLLDSDCTQPDANLHLSEHSLNNMGCSPDYYSEHITFIGEKEFEDAFDNTLIANALNDAFPSDIGYESYASEMIEKWRMESKFSDSLVRSVKTLCSAEIKRSINKRGIARAIAEHCQTEADVPQALLETLKKLRFRAGIEN